MLIGLNELCYVLQQLLVTIVATDLLNYKKYYVYSLSNRKIHCVVGRTVVTIGLY